MTPPKNILFAYLFLFLKINNILNKGKLSFFFFFY